MPASSRIRCSPPFRPAGRIPAELLQSKTRTVFGLSVPCDPGRGRSECFVFRVAHRSHHSLEQASPGISTAMWLNQLSRLAPCQCLTSAGMTDDSAGLQADRLFALLLVTNLAGGADQQLPPPSEAWWICQLFRHPARR